jgi:hypothetical protein
MQVRGGKRNEWIAGHLPGAAVIVGEAKMGEMIWIA